MSARSGVIELARTQPARLTANAIISVIPGARHMPGNIRMPPPPDALCDWEPIGFPATAHIGDDEDLASGFRSFGVTTIDPDAYEKPDLFVIAHAESLTANSYKGVLKLADRAKWFVLFTETVQNWADGRLEFEQRADGSASILAPIEWWISSIDNETSRMKLRHDLMWQMHILLNRLGVPRELDTVLFFEIQ